MEGAVHLREEIKLGLKETRSLLMHLYLITRYMHAINTIDLSPLFSVAFELEGECNGNSIYLDVMESGAKRVYSRLMTSCRHLTINLCQNHLTWNVRATPISALEVMLVAFTRLDQASSSTQRCG